MVVEKTKGISEKDEVDEWKRNWAMLLSFSLSLAGG